jgi:hypothetical protein
MKLKAIFVGLASVCVVGAISPGCGSSGSDTADAGGACSGLAAESAIIGFSATCEACIGKSCCSEFGTCLANSTCKARETCTGQCIVTMGTSEGFTCLDNCNDGGADIPSDVETLNTCIVGNCATPCGGDAGT